jgi:hypothetical protein
VHPTRTEYYDEDELPYCEKMDEATLIEGGMEMGMGTERYSHGFHLCRLFFLK